MVSETKGLSLIENNRHVESEQSQQFCFCNASKDAYATSIYLKTMVEGKPQINLIFAKSKISAMKMLCLPRLELMTLLLGVRSLKFVS